MKRELYMGGGIMNAVPREQAFVGGVFRAAKKAVKGVTGAVKKVAGGIKDIASSDIGKMALLAAATYGLNKYGLGPDKFGKSFMSNLSVPKFLQGKTGMAALGIGAGAIFGGAMAGKSEEEVQALTRDVPALKSYLTQYYTNLNPELRNQPEKVEEFVNSQIAEYNQGRGGYAMGGRMQYGDGTMSPDEYFSGKEKYMKQKQMEDMIREYERYMRDKNMKRDEVAMGGRISYADAGPVLPEDPTKPVNPFAPKPTGPVLPDRRMASNMENEKILEALFEKFLDMGLSPEKAAEEAKKEFERMSMMQTEGRGLAALGGRMNYALGDTASQNAMQAAGIEGLPMRQNPKGVQELDLRDNGGFIPPVGIKEKEDDIPAMLSNNEFVFTADAVRGMGDGDVELGAQRMYDQMKTLEEGGRV